MDIQLIIQLAILAGSLVTVYIGLNTKIAELEGKVHTNTQDIQNIENDRRDLRKELKEIKDLLIEMKVDLAVQKSRNTNESR